MIIDSKITRNRAEEYGFDLWEDFVIPPYFQSLKILKSEKPLLIEGGRGSGKTMLIRYLCHATQFSPKRNVFDDSSFSHIGIYWKMDVSFASLMQARGAGQDLWITAFENMAVLVLSMEVIKSLKNMSHCREDIKEDIVNLDLTELNDFDSGIPHNILDLEHFLKRRYNKFQVWVSNYKRVDCPIFYPILFLKVFIQNIIAQIPLLKNSFYSVYIDEYENLNITQKQIVNTWVKQSQTPLIFNIAMKKQSFDVADTLGTEKIIEVHDYRKIDIEELLKDHFETFASEIFLLKVNRYLFNIFHDDIEAMFFDPSTKALSFRLDCNYRKSIKTIIEKIFPEISTAQVAKEIFEDKVLRNKLLGLISVDLKKINQEEYYDYFKSSATRPEAYLILHALLNRRSLQFSEILKEFQLLCDGKKSRFDEWIKNNIFGCILNFYGKLTRPCPLFSGYSTFLTMSYGNIRHFLELCYTALSISDEWKDIHIVNRAEQLLAVKYVSHNMLNEIKKFGTKGNVLYMFSIRLGSIFEELRKKDSQSEPEQNQFSIKGQLPKEASVILRELVKWSVIFESKLTKQKGIESGSEFLFNPIYSAFFSISYRKKRRIELSSDEFVALLSEDEKKYEKVLKRFISDSIKDKKQVELPIFE